MSTKAIPQVRLNFFEQLRLVYEMRRDLLRVIQGFAKLGDIVQIPGGTVSQYLMFHPDMYQEVLVKQAASFQKDPGYTDPNVGLARFLGNGLVTSNGEFWRRQRKLTQPAFHVKRIEAYAQTMVNYTLDHLEGWRSGETRDIDREMMALTLKIVARTLFNSDVTDDIDRVGRAITILQHLGENEGPVQLPEWITHRKQDIMQGVQDIDHVVYRFVAEWRAQGEDHGDLLSMLMLAEDEDGNRMTDVQVRDEAVTLLAAGHETTANALNWTFYLLAHNPAVEENLHRELDTVLAGQPPKLDDLKRLPYTEMVIKESMRVYPPVPAISRQAVHDVEIMGYLIPKGSIVSIFPYTVHNDARFWDQPEAFMPERWAEGYPQQPPRYAYLPFGGGPRICIGNSFAMMEAQLLLASIASRYRLALLPNHQTVQKDPLVTLRPRGGLPMRLQVREPKYAAQPAAALI